MKSVVRLATAFAAGAAIMYYLDPVAGRRRRALMRDRGVAAGHDAVALAKAKAKRAADRLHGVAARTRSRLSSLPVDDEQLRERIRARLGHMLAHPREVTVSVEGGHVLLDGHVGRERVDAVIETVAAIPGVGAVESRLSHGRPQPLPH